MKQIDRIEVAKIGKRRFLIPAYQRGYRWGRQNVEALLNDLKHFLHSPDQTKYCLQPLVLQLDKDKNDLVVDGQQRLTTISIILFVLSGSTDAIPWDIIYTVEGNTSLKSLMKNPGDAINDWFREEVKAAVEDWINANPNGAKDLKRLLVDGLGDGNRKKELFFIQYYIDDNEDGQQAFNRLNAGKTPLTSSELLRAVYMVSDNGLPQGEDVSIAKEWELINSELSNETFWAIWNTKNFPECPTRMDFLFSVVAGVNPRDVRGDRLAIFNEFQEYIDTIEADEEGLRLEKSWEEVLRCWWWMKSCYSDDEIYHWMGWIATFTDNQVYTLYRKVWTEDSERRIDEFKKRLKQIIKESVIDRVEAYSYESNPKELRKLFVLLNSLQCLKHHDRLRFDLYRSQSWDIEHIASQTDNELTDPKEQEEWVRLAFAEMDEKERLSVSKIKAETFNEKRDAVLHILGHCELKDKNSIGNLALLDAGTNRAYKNAIFPAKRRTIFCERKDEKIIHYIMPCTELAFAKAYSPHAAQMRYWDQADADAYSQEMQKLLEVFFTEK